MKYLPRIFSNWEEKGEGYSIFAFRYFTFEDHFFSGNIATNAETLKVYHNRNLKRMKRISFVLTIFMYKIEIEIPYKKVGINFYGREIDILKKHKVQR